jgi:hypothetical protein
MKPQEFEVQVTIPIIPPRTSVELVVFAGPDGKAQEVQYADFRCTDCGFSSADVQVMLAHQAARRTMLGKAKHWWRSYERP